MCQLQDHFVGFHCLAFNLSNFTLGRPKVELSSRGAALLNHLDPRPHHPTLQSDVAGVSHRKNEYLSIRLRVNIMAELPEAQTIVTIFQYNRDKPWLALCVEHNGDMPEKKPGHALVHIRWRTISHLEVLWCARKLWLVAVHFLHKARRVHKPFNSF